MAGLVIRRLLIKMMSVELIIIIGIHVIIIIIITAIKGADVIYNVIIYNVITKVVAAVGEHGGTHRVDARLGQQLAYAALLGIHIEHVKPAVGACHQQAQIFLNASRKFVLFKLKIKHTVESSMLTKQECKCFYN